MSFYLDPTPPPQASASSSVLAQIDQYYHGYFGSPWWTPWAQDELNFDALQGSSFPNPEPLQYLGISLRPSRQADPSYIVHCVEIVCQLFRSGKYAPAAQRLDQANGQIKTLLLERAPPLLACLLSAVCLLDFLWAEMRMDPDRPDPLKLFLQFVSEMAETKLCSDHPIAQIFSSLAKMRTDHHSVAQMALRRIVETFRGKAGLLHPYHCRSAYNYAWVLIWRRQFDEARAVLEHFLDTIELRTGRDDTHCFASRYLLAQTHIALHKYWEAEQCVHKILNRANRGLGEDSVHLVNSEAWRMLAVIAGFQERFDERSSWKGEALECGEMLFGPQHPRVVQLQRVISHCEPRPASEKQCRFIWSLLPIGDERSAQRQPTRVL